MLCNFKNAFKGKKNREADRSNFKFQKKEQTPKSKKTNSIRQLPDQVLFVSWLIRFKIIIQAGVILNYACM
ncbi:hypothetical protein NC99_18530 [Sunxiuqinia dokdonensis]|uniref:Uncharacterized protein n=1 Tax=Sunxiuqinia dokdonensis TaxID=1409788 RepID=A0A0L8VA32_9BACT|nr:hypothetical protein NC99_18530 [Sunxiuqinia dokdonensis]